MKTCTKCGVEKEENRFNRRRANTEKTKSICVECARECSREHYRNHKKIYISRAKIFSKKQQIVNQQKMVEFLKTKRCVDCGNNDIRVLEFDHRNREDKKECIAQLLTRNSWELVMREINKCDIRCANCHRIKTSIQFNWFKNFDNKPLIRL